MHAAVSGFDVGMHTKATDDNAFRRFAKQVVIVVGLLRSGFRRRWWLALTRRCWPLESLFLLNRTGSWSP